jgi:hypothetical protein
VPAEKRLVRTITMTISEFKYNPDSRKWDRRVAGPNPGPIANVPDYPEGYGEPCTPTPRPRRKRRR